MKTLNQVLLTGLILGQAVFAQEKISRDVIRGKETRKAYFSAGLSQADIFKDFEILEEIIKGFDKEVLTITDVLKVTDTLPDREFYKLMAAMIKMGELEKTPTIPAPVKSSENNEEITFYKTKSGRLVNVIKLSRWATENGYTLSEVLSNWDTYFADPKHYFTFSNQHWTVSYDKYFGFKKCVETKTVILQNPTQFNYILFVIDNSGSMDKYQQALVDRTTELLNRINKTLKKGSFKVGISTSDYKTALPFTSINTEEDIEMVKEKIKVGTQGGDEYLFRSLESYLIKYDIPPRSNVLYIGLSDEPNHSFRSIDTIEGAQKWFENLFSLNGIMEGRFMGYNIVNPHSYEISEQLPYFQNYNINKPVNVDKAIEHLNKKILVDYNFEIQDDDIFGATKVNYTDYDGGAKTLGSDDWKMTPNTGKVSVFNVPNFVQELEVTYQKLCKVEDQPELNK